MQLVPAMDGAEPLGVLLRLGLRTERSSSWTRLGAPEGFRRGL